MVSLDPQTANREGNVSTAVIRTGQKVPLFPSTIARRRALLVDYDGTIAPFVDYRDRAHPYEQIPELLDEINSACNTRVAIVTGRVADEIRFLLKTKHPLEVWGCHGLERLQPNGVYWRATLEQKTEQALQSAVEQLQKCGFAGLIETKPGCVAIHWRGLTPRYSEEVKAAAYNCFASRVGGLLIQEFDHGVELRVRGCNKGRVVETILSELGREPAIAYLGDDTTDEDAFRALHGKGITILVRPSYRYTAAQFWLRPPDELVWFLRDWIDACKEEQ
jgi:trehalose 6-phosphate phosphatase